MVLPRCSELSNGIGVDEIPRHAAGAREPTHDHGDVSRLDDECSREATTVPNGNTCVWPGCDQDTDT